MRALSNLIDWLTLADYDRAKEQATVDVVARYSRGNVNVQNGEMLDEKDIERLAMNADRALARLAYRLPH